VSTSVQTDSHPPESPSGEILPKGPWSADKVAATATVAQAANEIHFAAWGETRITQPELERLVGAVPRTLAPALAKRYYYFVPLVIVEGDQAVAAPDYTVDLGDRAICHRNVSLGSVEAVFISTRLVEDRFGLAFEFFINVAHNFVDAVGVPGMVSGASRSSRRNQPGCVGDAPPRSRSRDQRARRADASG